MYKEEIDNHINTFNILKNMESKIDHICDIIINGLLKGNTLYIIGNGGSASDANHLAAEIIWKFEKERRALPAISLCSDLATITSISNDYSFDYVFSRQIEALAKKNDLLLCISTSGESINVINAINKSNDMGIHSISISGDNKDSTISKLSKYSLNFPSNETSRIQEMHLFFYHYLCKKIDQSI